MDKKPKVVVIGGGFGGLWAVRSLKKANVDITLIDKRNFHLFQPLLYQVATGALSPADIASPLRGILAKQKNASVQLGEMTSVDLKNNTVILKDGSISYDYLVIAAGSENYYFGNDQWESKAPGLKTVEDALRIRNHVFSMFEKAEKETDPEIRKKFLTFVIIGGGPTGVELAGSFAEISKITLKGNFQSINPASAKIILIEGGSEILKGYHPELRKKAKESIEKLGVKVKTGLYAKDIDEDGITIIDNNESKRIEAGSVYWAAGVKPSPLGKMIVSDDKNLNKFGQVIVNKDLTLPGHDNVYVIGDLAFVTNESGKALPGMAPVAMSEGRYAAKSIIANLNGKSLKPFKYFNKGNMAVLGRASAIADLGWARFSGYPAWLLWLFIHLMYLVEFDNRLIVFIQWAWNYFTRSRGARLITYDDKARF